MLGTKQSLSFEYRQGYYSVIQCDISSDVTEITVRIGKDAYFHSSIRISNRILKELLMFVVLPDMPSNLHIHRDYALFTVGENGYEISNASKYIVLRYGKLNLDTTHISVTSLSISDMEFRGVIFRKDLSKLWDALSDVDL